MAKSTKRIEKRTPEQFMKEIEAAMEKIAKKRERPTEFLHLTEHEGKLAGLQSLSTCSFVNPYCLKRMENKDSICYHCYVANYGYRRSLIAHLVLNFKRVTTNIISVDLLPVFYSTLGRIESFGDAWNETQVENYLNTIKKNAGTAFAIWSKNLGIYHRVFKRLGLPLNMSFVASSERVNEPYVVPEEYKYFVNAVFTVYSLAYLMEHPEIQIHCGFSKCIKCQICYRSRNAGRIIYVNEILKEDAAEYKKWNDAGRPAIWPAA